MVADPARTTAEDQTPVCTDPDALDLDLDEQDLSDPQTAAEAAGLIYLPDTGTKGITRERVGPPDSKLFRYFDPKGREITRTDVLERIRSLAIPPAYERVWISPKANGHLQATGYDIRGRKQYRYHPDWMKHRGETKFDRMLAFGRALPAIRRQVERALSVKSRRLHRERVLAAVVSLLDQTLVRVGNPEYAASNESYGLTTLQVDHLAGRRNLRFEFKGKSGILHEVPVEDTRLAKIIRACADLPGQHLFQFQDASGEPVPIRSQDVNSYIQHITKGSFSAKDFRTWGGSAFALEAFLALPEVPPSETGQKKAINEVLRQVAEKLGNTMTVCRKYYVHPLLPDTWRAGLLPQLAATYKRRRNQWLGSNELLLLYLLDHAQQIQTQQATAASKTRPAAKVKQAPSVAQRKAA